VQKPERHVQFALRAGGADAAEHQLGHFARGRTPRKQNEPLRHRAQSPKTVSFNLRPIKKPVFDQIVLQSDHQVAGRASNRGAAPLAQRVRICAERRQGHLAPYGIDSLGAVSRPAILGRRRLERRCRRRRTQERRLFTRGQ